MNHSTALLSSSAILVILVLSPIAAYAAGPGGFDSSPASPTPTAPIPGVLQEPNIFYGVRFQGSCPTVMDSYDPGTDTITSFTLTSTTSGGSCNGRGMAWDGTNLWYTVLGGGFVGDGKIHEVSPTGGADLATMPDPYGAGGRGIGAMKFDAPLPGGHLWTESYLPINNLVEVSELAVPSGAVLASCELPFQDGGAGSDTFSLFANNEFATDGGEILTTLFFYQEPALGSIGGSCVQVGPSVPDQGATGLNFASNGDCIYTNGGSSTFNGGPTCNVVKASTTNAFQSEEDISCSIVTTPPSLCALAAPIPPTVFTTLSQTSIAAGGAVGDAATLANLNAPTGTITFFFSGTNTCPNAGATQVGAPVTVAGNGVYNSALQTFPTAGTFYWYAVYGGDPSNNALTSACEPLSVRGGGVGVPEFGSSAMLIAGVGLLGVALLARKHRMSLTIQA
jgi:hypothetical protein